ncbi:hypothetical protein [Angustibacter luteus]|uniref:PD-(D/E)XK endonuclease-like domain-containing protein n=1 Tax=Angustibacter luteus TaxID=658456 RepID=A0ABW1JDL4_9ACTN
MGNWEALAFDSVRGPIVRAALAERGIVWNESAHVTATTTLASAIRERGAVALPIATLIDAIVMPKLAGGEELRVDGLPSPSELSSPKRYGEKMSAWQDRASGLRIQQYIQLEDRLRAYCREHASPEQYRVVTRGRREFTRTVVTLAASGVHPSEVTPQDPTANLAVRAWEDIETHVPGLTATRDDLWIDPDRFRKQADPDARALADRMDRALRHLFPVTGTQRIQVIHHGFYFFTPPQWALFQLLRELSYVDQCFVVHDDQHSEVFESWRRFFTTSWDMPRPVHVDSLRDAPTPAAIAFEDALRGEPVDSNAVVGKVRVLECASPTELVKQLTRESIENAESLGGTLYAAQAAQVDRFIRRLGTEAADGTVDLAQLPVGIFLLALHRCIEPVQTGLPLIRLASEDLLDMASTGFLDVDGGSNAADLVGVLRRATPFFQGCSTDTSWRERARLLTALVIGDVATHGSRAGTESDVARWQTAASNPLRLVPWADLTVDEARSVEGVVETVLQLAGRVASRERVSLREHVTFLNGHLERGMRGVPRAEQQSIRQKLQGLTGGPDFELDADGLIDVVTMLLGRHVEFEDDGRPDATGVRELRGLDALGFARTPGDVHLANLSATTFPSRGPSVGWPLRLEDLRRSPTMAAATLEILEARAELGALGDLYLLWLGLDGVEQTGGVTLSWIARVGGELQNASPLVTLLTVPDYDSPAVRQRAGGLPSEIVAPGSDLPPLTARPLTVDAHCDAASLDLAVAEIDPRAAGAGQACPRRFALQWAVGPTAAFQAAHHLLMLYGNMRNALVRLGFVNNELAASALANRLWPFLTPGQRGSSVDRAVIKPQGSRSADPEWLFTLAGSKSGSRPLDRAYKAASTRASPSASAIAPTPGRFLPAGIDDAATCRSCPVRNHCKEVALE